MTIRVLLVISDEGVKDAMVSTLAEVGDIEHLAVRSPEDAETALLAQPGLDVILVDEQVGRSAGTEVIRDLAARAPLAGVVLLATRPEARTLNEAMAAGARFVVTKPFSVEEVWSTLDAVAAWARTARSQVLVDGAYGGSTSGSGRVLAVSGSKGGTGTTVVAMLLAVAFAENQSICIIDFDLQTGDVAPYAGVKTTRSVVDLVDISGELTGRAVREMSYDLPEGMKLLPAPAHGERGEEMTGLATRNILSALRHQFDLVIVDCGARLDDANAMALELADVAVLVATSDIPALRSARTKLALWERLNVRGTTDTALILNMASSKREVQPELATKIVGLEVIGTVQEGGGGFESVMNTAAILSDRNTVVHRGVAAVATGISRRWFSHEASSSSKGSGRRSRNRGARSAEALPDSAPRLPQLAQPTLQAAQPQPMVPRVPTLQMAPPAQHGAAQGSNQPVYPPTYAPRPADELRDRGQASVQMPLVTGFILLLLLICSQFVLFGATHIVAQNSADEAARWLGAGASASVVQHDFRDALPSLWQNDARVSAIPGGDAVEVTLDTPRLIPFGDFKVKTRAAILKEMP